MLTFNLILSLRLLFQPAEVAKIEPIRFFRFNPNALQTQREAEHPDLLDFEQQDSPGSKMRDMIEGLIGCRFTLRRTVARLFVG